MDTLDWTQLNGVVNPDLRKIAYEPNKHLFTKVAFDVFQLSSSPVDSLWILEEGDDGKQYLVARYDEEIVDEGLKSESSAWNALPDKEAKNVTLFYKDSPIQRFASEDYGFTAEDVGVFQQTLVEKLSSDKSFREKFLNSQPKSRRDALLQQFPELAE